jgi:Flp pilus assembly protein TadG
MPSKATLSKLEQLVTDYESLAAQLQPLQEQQRHLRQQIQSLGLTELDASNPKLQVSHTLLQFKKGYTTWTWNTEALNGYIAAGHPGLAEFRREKQVGATIAFISSPTYVTTLKK